MGNCCCWGTKITAASPASPSDAGSASHNNKQKQCARRKGKGGPGGGLMSNNNSGNRARARSEAAVSVSTSTSTSTGGSTCWVAVPAIGSRSEGEILQSANVRSFSFSELRTSTRNFRPDSVLGEGGFGSVFKGWIDERTLAPTRPGTGMVIAVKKLNQEGFQGHREWLAEVNYLGQLSHPNLVKLVGYCLEDEQRLLVYEFMPRGSLENHLFRRGSHFQPLSWNLRMKVALGAAKGLAFLHSDRAKVIYRDFKTSNVLLDSKYNAKLSDFGLAKDGPTGDKSHVSTRVMGTYGYAAPEYLATGHLSAKSDVYSFGVVLLEMLSGRRALDKNRPSDEHNLVEWARPYLSSSKRRRLLHILDARLDSLPAAAHSVAALALQCLSADARNRPTMDQVVAALQQCQEEEEQTHQQQQRTRVLGSNTNRSSRSRNKYYYYPAAADALTLNMNNKADLRALPRGLSRRNLR